MIHEKIIDTFISTTKLRAKAYAYFYEEAEKEVGQAKAVEMFKRAAYRLGLDKSKSFRQEAHESAAELAEDFKSDPVGEHVFQIKIINKSENKAEIAMSYCPLLEMWREMKYSPDEICRLCDIAHQIDYGTIEGCGFALEFPERAACCGEKCILKISKKNA
jgi:hypothetical protein